MVNKEVVYFGSLLHDVGDHKYKADDPTYGQKKVTSFLQSLLQPESIIEGVIYIINNISFTTEIGNKNQLISPFINELYIIQDADRLDAIGAIGLLLIYK